MFTTYSKKQCEVETTGKNDCKHHRDDRIGVERVIIYMKRIAKKIQRNVLIVFIR